MVSANASSAEPPLTSAGIINMLPGRASPEGKGADSKQASWRNEGEDPRATAWDTSRKRPARTRLLVDSNTPRNCRSAAESTASGRAAPTSKAEEDSCAKLWRKSEKPPLVRSNTGTARPEQAGLRANEVGPTVEGSRIGGAAPNQAGLRDGRKAPKWLA